MRIELHEMFSSSWRAGYIVTNRENRRMVCLFNSSTDRTTMSYARYLLSVKIGRMLLKNEEADHIDGDKTNDDPINLQVLSKVDNIRKTHAKGETMHDFVCPVCGVDFKLSSRQSHRKNPSCSLSCGYKKSSITMKKRVQVQPRPPILDS